LLLFEVIKWVLGSARGYTTRGDAIFFGTRDYDDGLSIYYLMLTRFGHDYT